MKRALYVVWSVAMLLVFTLSGYAQNLLTNGNFEQGNTGFTSDYTYIPGDGTHHTEIGQYSVVDNPATAFTNGYLSFGDHTTGSGLMFFGDGAGPNLNVWAENVNLTAGEYSFSAWVADPDPSLINPANLAFFVNGNQTGAAFTSTEVGQWQQWSLNFELSTSGNQLLSIRDINPSDGSYDDFAMDDLSLTKNGSTSTTPEPSSFLLLGSGVLGCVGAIRRRRESGR